MIDDATLRAALAMPLEATHFDGLGARYEGKVRDNYTTPDGRRVLVTTDRISAFDRVLGTLPLKGQVLQRLSTFWFERTRELAPNHLVREVDPNIIEAIECEPLRVEFIVRAYLTGVTSTSIWTHYSRGERVFCGHALPDGMRKNQPLPAPILTPSTKAPQGEHDVSASRDELIKMGAISADDFDEASSMAMRLFSAGQAHCAAQGLILVDTKYEIGRAPDGKLVVIDEIHTPDSSRFWFSSSYEVRMREGAEPESFDKEYVRRWLSSQGYRGDGEPPPLPDEIRIEAARRYVEACERVMGSPFEANLEPPDERMRRNLGIRRAG